MSEGRNASMTTATMSYEELQDYEGNIQSQQEAAEAPEEVQTPDTHATTTENAPMSIRQQYYGDGTIGDYSMNNAMDQQLMRNVEQFVLQNMNRGQISLEEMATAMGMGRVPFFHKIRSITTKTPAEVVRDLRLKHACTLLVNTNVNMSELALNVGFMTAENFINIFKEKFGMTPLEYRLKNRKM
jgi:AraC-like DNA-binding protein